MEIGFGGGEHLLHEARRCPKSGFIGVEPFVNSMAKLVVDLHEDPIQNIRLYDDDATQVLDWLPEAPWTASICFIPIHGRRRSTGNAVSSARKISTVLPGF